jgi:uncharacterized iron-regulated protein
MARPDHRSNRAQARKSSLKEDKSNASATTSSISEEDSGVFDSILSTMCCRSLSSVSYSRSKEIVEEDDREVKNENYFWDEMRSFFLYGIRPVAYITIQESSSVDGSELTLPHVLVRMAEKHDKLNADEVFSMIQGDNNSMVLSNSSSLGTKSRGMRRSDASSFVKSVRSRRFKYYKRGNKEKVGVIREK